MRKEVKAFTLPGQEFELEEIINDDLRVIKTKIITPCPKEGIIIVYIECENYNEEGVLL